MIIIGLTDFVKDSANCLALESTLTFANNLSGIFDLIFLTSIFNSVLASSLFFPFCFIYSFGSLPGVKPKNSYSLFRQSY